MLVLRKYFAACVVAWCATTSPAAHAGIVLAGAPITTVPAVLLDPVASLSLGLTAGQFLVQVNAEQAVGLELWSFDLLFDNTVASPFDAGGLFQYIYAADFGGGQESKISGSGVLFDSNLGDVSGFFNTPVNGSGPLAFVLFSYVTGQEDRDLGISVVDTSSPRSVPEPSSAALVGLALAAAAVMSARRRL